MMHALAQRLIHEFERLQLIGQSILIGVSGGADSTALVWLTAEIQTRLEIQVQLAHINHRLRGVASEHDAAWVTQLADRAGFKIHTRTLDMSAEMRRTGAGVEEAARNARYRELQQIAQQSGCSSLLVAHTEDDQAETILHHILRGTGIGGLRGIPEQRPLSSQLTLVRPLLTTARHEIEKYLRHRDEQYREDLTNRDQNWTRNRIRHDLIPLLRNQFNGQITQALLRLGRQASEVQDSLEWCVGRELGSIVLERTPSVCRLEADRLNALPDHMRRECFRQLWIQQNWPRQRMGFREWQRLTELADGQHRSIELPGGIRAELDGGLVRLHASS